MKAGTEFLGESFIFFVAAGIYAIEHFRSLAKSKKQEAKKEERRNIKLEQRVRDHKLNQLRIQELEDRLDKLDGQKSRSRRRPNNIFVTDMRL